MQQNLKERTLEIGEALYNQHDALKLKELLSEDFIQHNPLVPTGMDGIIKTLPVLDQYDISYKNIRLFQDGNYVIMHNTLVNTVPFGGDEIVTVDVYRFDDKGIAREHWDGVMPKMPANPSGRTLIDGYTEIEDLELTGKNKAFVTEFITKVILEGKSNLFTDYVNAEKYIQHNPHTADGLKGLAATLESGLIKFSFSKLHKVFAEGNFVITVAEGSLNDVPTAFYDIFRIENGKIVEHWDVTQTIPTEAANENTMFNFK